MNNKQKVGIKQQLEAATDKTQVEMLLEQVRSFNLVSNKTLRRCERTAKAKLERFGVK